MTTSPVLETIDQQLGSDFGGRVITPSDADYDDVRTVFPGGIDRRPAAIVRPADAYEVARVVSIAREAGVALAVRGGGHSPAGYGLADGGLTLDVRDMRGIEIDVQGRTAWAETGLTAGQYTEAAAEHGLATGFGDAATVGIGGITLGGGVGYLSRAHGLTIDNLLAAEIVTAGGEILEVDDEHHPDLFWAIRGGGGNFGVATRFKFRLREVDGVVGGILILPATAETVSGFAAAAEAAPDALSTIANVMPAPPMPFVPAELHGELVIMAFLCHCGAEEDGQAAIEPFRSLAEPIADMVAPIPYPKIYPPEQEGYHPTVVSRTMFLDRVDGPTAETIVDRLASSDAAMRVTQLRVLGGAIARVPAEATAFAHRGANVMCNVVSFYDGSDDRLRRQAWVDQFAGEIRQEAPGAYVNFMGDEGTERLRAAYPGATWDRLTEIKRRYDPDNLFRSNQNIPPT
ncbi:MAG: FAD-binding oxidoreductase [Solirubrobacterales bacterium]